jgi:broad specificity phosphatase PhoE
LISGQRTGRTDIPLTDRGEHAEQDLGARWKGLSFANVFTSPLQQARRTGELAGPGESAEIDPETMPMFERTFPGPSDVSLPRQ